MSGPNFVPSHSSVERPNPQDNQGIPQQTTIRGRLWQLLTSNFLVKFAQKIATFVAGIFASKKASAPTMPSVQPAQNDDLTKKTSEVARQAAVVPLKESPQIHKEAETRAPTTPAAKPPRKVAVKELKPNKAQEPTPIRLASEKTAKQAQAVQVKEKPKAIPQPAATLPKARVLKVTEFKEEKSLEEPPAFKQAEPQPLAAKKMPAAQAEAPKPATEFKEEKPASPALVAKQVAIQASLVLSKEMAKADEIKLNAAAPAAAEPVQNFSNFRILPEKVQNVPDDGACLVYALALGLKKKGAGQPDIQAKLNWDIDLEQLKGDLRLKYQGGEHDSDLVKAEKKALNQRVLSPAAQKLRNEAADLLKAKLAHPEDGWLWQMRIQEDIDLHNRSIRRKINEQESLLPSLKENVVVLNSFLETLNQGDVKRIRDQFSSSEDLKDLFEGSNELRALKKKIMDPQTQSLKDEEGKISTRIRYAKAQKEADIQASEKQNTAVVAVLRKKLIDPNSAEAEAKYIELSKEADFYCGPNQILMLSELYGVTISMWKPAIIRPGMSTESFIKNSEATLQGQVLKPTIHTHEGKEGIWVADVYGNEEKGPIIHVLHVNGNHFQYLDQ